MTDFGVKVELTETEKRKSICETCEFLYIIPLIKRPQCKKCGCFLDFKWRWSKSQCPIGKW